MRYTIGRTATVGRCASTSAHRHFRTAAIQCVSADDEEVQYGRFSDILRAQRFPANYGCAVSESWVDGLGLQGEDAEYRLVNFPEWGAVDEGCQGFESEAVLAAG